MTTAIAKLKIVSDAFRHTKPIPSKYTCQDDGVSPPFSISELPENTKSLAIIVEDPDAPNGTFDHWVVWNIKPTRQIPENILDGTKGKNSNQLLGYTGPFPPSGKHRYFFKISALDELLGLAGGADKKALLHAMHDHIIAAGEIQGTYAKK
ncbi:MAG TPA: YbhB/YbcL family Raf kinase inhibitor-like protein [Puia sp.]|nr:YbhB/YbcL family Raf kinase inhibitor-like protein [Puia sp.]